MAACIYVADTSGRFHIRRSQYKNGKYETPVRPSFSVDAYGDVDPVVAPDESFLNLFIRPPACITAYCRFVYRFPYAKRLERTA